MAAGARVSYHLKAHESTALQLDAYKGPIVFIMSPSQSGVFVGLDSLYVHPIVEEGRDGIDASSSSNKV